ncbi:Protein of unknown function D, partial [Prunus dulcis]
MRKYYEYWTSVRRWRTHEPELHPYFVHGDLWESFKDWSAYVYGEIDVIIGSGKDPSGIFYQMMTREQNHNQ